MNFFNPQSYTTHTHIYPYFIMYCLGHCSHLIGRCESSNFRWSQTFGLTPDLQGEESTSMLITKGQWFNQPFFHQEASFHKHPKGQVWKFSRSLSTQKWVGGGATREIQKLCFPSYIVCTKHLFPLLLLSLLKRLNIKCFPVIIANNCGNWPGDLLFGI